MNTVENTKITMSEDDIKYLRLKKDHEDAEEKIVQLINECIATRFEYRLKISIIIFVAAFTAIILTHIMLLAELTYGVFEFVPIYGQSIFASFLTYLLVWIGGSITYTGIFVSVPTMILAHFLKRKYTKIMPNVKFDVGYAIWYAFLGVAVAYFVILFLYASNMIAGIEQYAFIPF